MSVVALDLSVKSTGWAMWSPGQERPAHGTWELAPGIEWAARAFVRLHRNLLDLNKIEKIERLVFEEPIPAYQLQGHTNVDTLLATAGLAAHAMSFAEAIGCSWRPIGISIWRKHWIGKMPRGTGTPDLKYFAMRRCRELGFEVAKHDEAEAIGILDYELAAQGLTPPWREQFLLGEQFAPRPKRGRG